MPPYPLHCYQPGCSQPAVYKIASRWSDGVTSELKTYALSCDRCVADWFRKSLQKQSSCRTVAGETLEPPGIFRISHGQRDRQLERLADLEVQIRAGSP